MTMTTTRAVAVAGPDPEERAGAGEQDSERGLATAEYAIATVAAATFAGILLAVVKGGDVKGMLTSLIQSALSLG